MRGRRTIPPADPALAVAQAIPKGERGQLAVELMTEVGVDVVIPWAAQRCVVRWSGERGDRALAGWRSTAREAGKQARRARFPEVTGPAGLPGVTARVAAAACAIVLDPDAETALGALPLPGTGEILLVVGPEGGIAPDGDQRAGRGRRGQRAPRARPCSAPPPPVRSRPPSCSAGQAAGPDRALAGETGRAEGVFPPSQRSRGVRESSPRVNAAGQAAGSLTTTTCRRLRGGRAAAGDVRRAAVGVLGERASAVVSCRWPRGCPCRRRCRWSG